MEIDFQKQSVSDISADCSIKSNWIQCNVYEICMLAYKMFIVLRWNVPPHMVHLASERLCDLI